MATLRDIKRRIVGVQNTQKITKAMKMVAAARLRRAQMNVVNARPYSNKISELIRNLISLETDFAHPLLQEREVNKVAIVVITSDRGLCGAFNMNAIRFAQNLVDNEYADYKNSDNLLFYTIGKKAGDYFSSRIEVKEKHSGIFSPLRFEFASVFINDLKLKYLAGEIDKVLVVYNEFVSVATQNVKAYQLLPIISDVSGEEEPESFGEFIFEPDKKSIIDALLPRHLNAQMWKMLLESYAAELGARMTAMEMATENAKELIRTLTITYNKERQAAITKEILEIVSGANALKDS